MKYLPFLIVLAVFPLVFVFQKLDNRRATYLVVTLAAALIIYTLAFDPANWKSAVMFSMFAFGGLRMKILKSRKLN